MNIEEARSKLISFIDFYNKKSKEENRKFKMLQVDNIDIKAIETLLTAYEEKCKELKKEIQDDLDVRNRWGLTLQELEKEKEKNKELENCLQMAKQIMTANISEDFGFMKLKEFEEYLLNEIKQNENFEE